MEHPMKHPMKHPMEHPMEHPMKHPMEHPVYEPREDSFLLLKHVKDYAKGRVLDMCTGSGILAKEAMKYAEEVVATDINKTAAAYFEKTGIAFIHSDLFENIEKEKKFDLIICNPPYLPSDSSMPDPALDGGVGGWELIARFLREAARHLKEKGKILLLFSSLSKKDKVDGIIRNEGMKAEQIDAEQHGDETLHVYLTTK